MSAAALPRTRSVRRAGRGGGWRTGAALAVAVNAGVILALGSISRLHRPEPPLPAPLAIAITAVEPPAEPPPPESAEAAPVADAAVPAPAPPALPAVEIPAGPAAPDALALPPMTALDAPAVLPLTLPAVVADLPAAPAAAPGAGTAIDVPFVPATRRGEFDLERFYPRAARLRAITGSTRVRIVIDANGVVTGAAIIDSSPPGVFDQAAERLARSLRHDPARLAQLPVASEQVITIEWRIR